MDIKFGNVAMNHFLEGVMNGVERSFHENLMLKGQEDIPPTARSLLWRRLKWRSPTGTRSRTRTPQPA